MYSSFTCSEMGHLLNIKKVFHKRKISGFQAGGWVANAPLYVFAPPLKMGNIVPNNHEFGVDHFLGVIGTKLGA